MTLDQQRFDSVRDAYARMSDEQLALIVATRLGGLTGEARAALNDVMTERDLSDFEAELRSVRTQLAWHARHADSMAQRGAAHRRSNYVIPVACLLVMAAGACLIAASDAALGYASVILVVLLYSGYRTRGSMRLAWLVLRPGSRLARTKT